MLAEISHGKSQALLKQRNILLISTVALLVIVLMQVGLLLTRDREIVLQPVLPRPIAISSDHVSREYMELTTRDTALLILNRSPSGLDYWMENVLSLVDPSAYGEVKSQLIKMVNEQKGSDISQAFTLTGMTIDTRNLTAVVSGRLQTSVGKTVISNEPRQFAFKWRYSGLSLRLVRFGLVASQEEQGK